MLVEFFHHSGASNKSGEDTTDFVALYTSTVHNLNQKSAVEISIHN